MKICALELARFDLGQARPHHFQQLGVVELLVAPLVEDVLFGHVAELVHEADQALHLHQRLYPRGAVDELPGSAADGGERFGADRAGGVTEDGPDHHRLHNLFPPFAQRGQGAVEVEDHVRRSGLRRWVEDHFDLRAGVEPRPGRDLGQFGTVDVVGVGRGRRELGRRGRARGPQFADRHRGGNVGHVGGHRRRRAAGEHGAYGRHHRIAGAHRVHFPADVDSRDHIDAPVIGGDHAAVPPGNEEGLARLSRHPTGQVDDLVVRGRLRAGGAKAANGLGDVQLQDGADVGRRGHPGVDDEHGARMSRDHGVDPGHNFLAGETAGYLLVHHHDVRPGGGVVESLFKGAQGRPREGVPGAEIETVLLVASRVGLGVDQRLPLRSEVEHAGGVRPQVPEQLDQDPAERVPPVDADGTHLAHAQGDQVGDDVAGPARAVTLAGDPVDGQPGLDRELLRLLVQLPVGVQAEIAGHGDLGLVHAF